MLQQIPYINPTTFRNTPIELTIERIRHGLKISGVNINIQQFANDLSIIILLQKAPLLKDVHFPFIKGMWK